MSRDEAWDQLAEEEANALATLLHRDDRRVLVVVIGSDGASGWMAHGVAGTTRKADCAVFVDGLNLRAERIAAKITEGSDGPAS